MTFLGFSFYSFICLYLTFILISKKQILIKVDQDKVPYCTKSSMGSQVAESLWSSSLAHICPRRLSPALCAAVASVLEMTVLIPPKLLKPQHPQLTLVQFEPLNSIASTTSLRKYIIFLQAYFVLLSLKINAGDASLSATFHHFPLSVDCICCFSHCIWERSHIEQIHKIHLLYESIGLRLFRCYPPLLSFQFTIPM